MNEAEVKLALEKLHEKWKRLKLDIALEGKDNRIAAEILLCLLREKPVSNEQLRFLKDQSVDFSKILVLIGLQAIPGSSIGIIALEKTAEKYGFTLLPQPDRKIPAIK